jgi:hypothetical protein
MEVYRPFLYLPTGSNCPVGLRTNPPAMKLTPKEAAIRARVSLSLVYQWCQHSLTHYRFGQPGKRSLIRIETDDLDHFIAGFRKEGEQVQPPLALKHIKLK